MKLPKSFYDRPTLEVARDLLGKVLVHRRPRAMTSGIIVEVEAYVGESDPACHAAPGPTGRNEPLYGPPGYSYVYLNYGIHCLVNVVTEAEGSPAAVLIRALAPLDGIASMRRRRRPTLRRAAGRPEQRRGATRSRRDEAVQAPSRAIKGRRVVSLSRLAVHELCRGPGNLTMAMGITLDENRLDLVGDRLFIDDRGIEIGPTAWSPRVGISVGVERPWRCYVVGNPAVSVTTKASPRRNYASGR